MANVLIVDGIDRIGKTEVVSRLFALAQAADLQAEIRKMPNEYIGKTQLIHSWTRDQMNSWHECSCNIIYDRFPYPCDYAYGKTSFQDAHVWGRTMFYMSSIIRIVYMYPLVYERYLERVSKDPDEKFTTHDRLVYDNILARYKSVFAYSPIPTRMVAADDPVFLDTDYMQSLYRWWMSRGTKHE